MVAIHALARIVVFAAFAAALVVSCAAWLVRTRRISPFSALARGIRSMSDPILRPIEGRLVRAGGNPVNAGWWLVIGVAIVGVLLLSLLDWAGEVIAQAAGATAGGPRALIRLAIVLAYNVLFVALLVRVIGSWLGAFRYSRWMRPAYALTDWVVTPISRALPPTGMFDLSPLAAWFVLWVLRQLLLSIV
jgi:YggT family protein